MKNEIIIKHLFFFLINTFATFSYAQTTISVEASQLWQSRNDQRIPGNTGTAFSISDIDSGPYTAFRIYAARIWDNRHEVRALYAPLEIDVDGQFDQNIFFQDTTFAANTNTQIYYKFNSYRLTYAYHFDPWQNWQFAIGFTGKVRDAEVRLEQSGLVRSKKNMGFVPLLNLQARFEISNYWGFRFDFDGLAAPQGRAFDAAFFIERHFEAANIFVGYRTIEGGADNDKVYNFAWFHQAVLGLSYNF